MVVVINFGKAELCLFGREHHGLVDLGDCFGCAASGKGRTFHGMHELGVILPVFEYLDLLLLFALEEGAFDHLLLDLAHRLICLQVMSHLKIIIIIMQQYNQTQNRLVVLRFGVEGGGK